ncbi:MAG: hypothetical protein ACOYBE_00290 [Blautia sp.]|jgi:hypothetical protein
MKMRLLAAVMAGVLFAGCLMGCGGEKETKTAAMGRFMEEDEKLPDGINRIIGLDQLSDGTLLMLGEDTKGGTRYWETSKDGGRSWESQTFPEGFSKEKLVEIDHAEISPEGEILVEALDESWQTKFYLYADGQVTPFDPKLDPYDAQETAAASTSASVSAESDGEEKAPDMEALGESVQMENMVREVKFGPDGTLLVQDLNGNVMEMDKTSGKCLYKYAKGSASGNMQTAGNMLIIMGTDGPSYYDIAQKEEVDGQNVLTEALGAKSGSGQGNSTIGEDMICTAGAQEGNLVYCSRQGLFSYLEGGSTVEQLINGDLNSISNPGQELLQLLCLDKEQYLLAVYDSHAGESHLYRYVYDETVPTVPDKELKIFTLQDSSELRQAIAVYRKEHPEVYVNLEAALTGEDGITVEDAIRTQNTSQMAGKGADILIMDGFPLESYLEKGLLKDISDVVDDVQEKDGIFENIRKAYEEDGKVYALPARFFLPVVEGDEATVKAGKDLGSLAEYAMEMKEKSPDAGIITASEPSEVLEEFYHGESGHWMQDGELSRDKIKSYLEASKAIYDTRLTESDEGIPSVSFSSNISENSAISGTITSAGLNCAIGYSRMAYGLMGGISDYMTMLAIEQAKGLTHGEMGTGKSFVPYLLAGISSKSEMETEAKNFLKILWGKDASSTMLSGIPVNRAALAVIEENVENGVFAGGMALMNSDGTMSMLDMKAPSAEEMLDFYQMAEQVEIPELSSQVIKDLVMEEGTKYLAGSTDLDTALKAIMQKASLYFSE